jgi:hypothetical protein
MDFVLPERKRPSYAAFTRALGVGTLVAACVAVVAVQLVTAGEDLTPTTVAFVAIPLSMPGGVWLTRIALARRTGYVIPWWIAFVGVVASWAATPWAGGWVLREILSGTFGGEDTDSVPAPTGLVYETGLDYIPQPLPVAAPFLEAPDSEALAALRIVEAPPAAALDFPPAPAEPEAHAAEPPAEPVQAAALALTAPLAPAYEPDPEPTPVAAPTEPALAEAAPIVVAQVAPIHALPPLEETEIPFFLPSSDLESAAVHDPFASFWLDPQAPSPEGLTPGYLPPLAGMWRTPLGDKL